MGQDVSGIDASGASGSSATVLVVDDDTMVRETLVQMLQLLGYDVLAADDGSRAIEVCASRGAEVDLILLDLSMPNLSAGETIRQVREQGTSCPVILMSGFVESEAGRLLDATLLAGFLQKPFPPELLLETVRGAISQ